MIILAKVQAMKKNKLFIVTLLVLILIAVCFFFNTSIFNRVYDDLLEQQIANECQITATSMVNEITKSIDAPLSVSQTMADNQFLISVLKNEPLNDADMTDAYKKQIQTFLNDYYKKYPYSSLFLVSTATGRYYHQDGVNRVLTPDNPENEWYYTFLKSGQDISLDIDNDEANNNTTTLFVDCKVKDSDSNTLGVIGVGLNIASINDEIDKLAQIHYLNGYLINTQGRIQMSSNDMIVPDSSNVMEYEKISESLLKELIAEPSKGQWYTDSSGQKYAEVLEVPGINWYLLVTMKDAAAVAKFQQRKVTLYSFVILLLVLLFGMTFLLFRRFRKIQLDEAMRDKLTGLYNRQAVGTALHGDLEHGLDKYSFLFILDIDNFKGINDTEGHTCGDRVLKETAAEIKKASGKNSICIRWGGDEFLGILKGDRSSAENVLKEIHSGVQQIQMRDGRNTTVSIGAAAIQRDRSFEEMTMLADQALYVSKENGKNRITWQDAMESCSNH